MSKSITVEKGKSLCKVCRGEMFTKKHSKITSKELSRNYYFSQWDYCIPCKRVQHYERYKVITRKGAAYYESLDREGILANI